MSGGGPKMAFFETNFLKSNNCYHAKLHETAAAPGEGLISMTCKAEGRELSSPSSPSTFINFSGGKFHLILRKSFLIS